MTPEQLAAIQQVWPQGGELFVKDPQGGFVTVNRVWPYAEAERDDKRERFSRILIPPLDPLKVQVEAFGNQHKSAKLTGIQNYAVFGDTTMTLEKLLEIIQSWEKFKGGGDGRDAR